MRKSSWNDFPRNRFPRKFAKLCEGWLGTASGLQCVRVICECNIYMLCSTVATVVRSCCVVKWWWARLAAVHLNAKRTPGFQ